MTGLPSSDEAFTSRRPGAGPGLAGARADDDTATLLARLESKAEAVQEAAEEQWEDLEEAQQIALARAALATPDAPGAMQAAWRTSPWALSLSELPAQLAALKRWDGWDTQDRAACFGGDDIATVYAAPGSTQAGLDNAHRTVRAQDVPALLALLAEGEDPFDQIGNALKITAWFTDDHRELLAPLFCQRLAGRHDVEPQPPPVTGSAIPTNVQLMLRAVWGLEGQEIYRKQAVALVPWAWVMRWACELTPNERDLPLLDEIIAESDDEPRAWALRHRVRLSRADAAEWLRTLLSEDPDDVEAAAHLALVGDREPWDALVVRLQAEHPRALPATPLVWRIDRDAAARSFDGAPDLSFQVRALWRAVWHVKISGDDMRNVVAHLGTVEDGLAQQVAFYTQSYSAGLRGAAARQLAQDLSEARSYASAFDSVGEDTLTLALAILGVREPQELRKLLEMWVIAETRLASIATSALLELRIEMDPSEAWDNWMAGTDRDVWPDPSSIGLHPHPAMQERLRDLALKNDERTSAAVRALARASGMSAAAAGYLDFAPDDDWTVPPWSDARDAVLAGRPYEALHLLYADTMMPAMGVHLDEIDLRRWQERRAEGTYWNATLGLAFLGDVKATAEIAAVLRDNRTELMDGFGFYESVRGARVFADDHAERLGHNCCSHFQAVEALRASFPTIPLTADWPFMPDHKVARAWLASMESRVEWSPLVEGWIPR